MLGYRWFNSSVIKSLPSAPEAFYRNYVDKQDDPSSLDRMSLLLTGMYKFARHEWVANKGAWDVLPNMANSHTVEDNIRCVHFAEEFCHVRLFDEMLRTCSLGLTAIKLREKQ